jgi:RNA polymerase sigma factor (sigma-70 family)
MEQLVSDHMRLAYAIANKYRGCGMEMAELESAAMFGLAKAAVLFDPSRGTRFSAFASAVMENAVRMDLRRLKRHFGQISLDAEISSAESEKITLMNILSYEEPGFEHVDNSDLIPSLLSGLQEREARAIRLVVCSGMTGVEAAKKMGISTSGVSRYIKSGIAKIRERGVLNEFRKDYDGQGSG